MSDKGIRTREEYRNMHKGQALRAALSMIYATHDLLMCAGFHPDEFCSTTGISKRNIEALYRKQLNIVDGAADDLAFLQGERNRSHNGSSK